MVDGESETKTNLFSVSRRRLWTEYALRRKLANMYMPHRHQYERG